MPKDNKNNSRKINGILDDLNKQTNDIFKTTYSSTETNKKMFDTVSDDLTLSIRKAIQGDSNYEDISNTTRFYQALVSKSDSTIQGTNMLDPNSKEGNIMDIFEDKQTLTTLMDAYASTKWINVLDSEIDMCLKWMPKLRQALNIKKDNVLCADSFNKSFISTKLEDSMNSVDKDKFAANAKSIMKTYDFENKCDQWYDSAATYGEAIVYHVPYTKAFETLLARKASTNYAIRESAILENGVLQESYKPPKVTSMLTNLNKENADGLNINLKMDKTGMLSDVVTNIHEVSLKLEGAMYQSMYDEVISENTSPETKKVKLNRTIGDVLEIEDEDSAATDGLIGATKKKNKINVPGCVLKTLERSKVLPLYIEDIFLGCYYVKISTENLSDVNASGLATGYNTITSMFNDQTTPSAASADAGDQTLKYIAGKISENIDAAFINANQDLREEIYMMLKYNDTFNQVANTIDINVTFIPPEDVTFIKFNEDPRTHRGRSDLWFGLLAAKMWIMLKTTSVIGNVTRGQDKRVYYVKTMVETNVARTLLNVVSQLKKGNFGMRQMESINNILNIVGKFNDFIIPVGPSGDSPITFDILQGQQFELPADMMNDLEESAVGSIVPIEIVNSSFNMDYAIRYTMTNGRMLRDVLKRQNYISKMYSRIFTKIYNCEFNDNADVSVVLATPAFLAITQGSQLLQTASQYVTSLADIVQAGKDDIDRNMFIQKMLYRSLSTYVDVDMVNEVLDEIELDKSIEKTKKSINTSEE